MSANHYSIEELEEIGFKHIGENVLISRKVSIYGASEISIGNHVRIDDFCVLSGEITLGNYIHIAVFCSLFGGSTGIEMKDFSGLSSRSVIYAQSDDYSGEFLTNPTVPAKYLNIYEKKVIIGKHSLIGTGCTILPGVEIGEGSAIGSMSLVNKSVGSWGIYVGIPCKLIKPREKKLLELEKQLMAEI